MLEESDHTGVKPRNKGTRMTDFLFERIDADGVVQRFALSA